MGRINNQLCFNEGDTQQSGTDKPVALGFRIELEFGNVGFCGERKTGLPGEKPLVAGTRTKHKLNPHMTPGPGVEPGPHWWETSALTAAPSLLPLRIILLGICTSQLFPPSIALVHSLGVYLCRGSLFSFLFIVFLLFQTLIIYDNRY